MEVGSMIEEMEQSFQVNGVTFLSLICFDVFDTCRLRNSSCVLNSECLIMI